MKIRIKLLSICLLGLTLFSCTEDFLVKNKIGEQTTETFFQTDEHAMKAATAAYSQLWHYRYVSSSFCIGNITADDAVKGSEPGDMQDMLDMQVWNLNASNMMMSWKYPRIWEGVLKCNQVIYNLDGVDKPLMDDDLQKRVVAEARFLRAYFYFDGVRTWGGLPKIDKPLQLNEMNQTRATAKEIYDFIIEDLIAAEKDLPKKSEYAEDDLGRATKGAAQALLVKVYCYMASPGYKNMDFYNEQGWTEAKKWAEKLFVTNEYELYQGYFGDIFDEIGENGPGSIFEIQFTETDSNGDTFNNNGNFTTVFTMPRGPWGWGLLQPTYDLYAEYESDDPRRDATLITSEAVVADEVAFGAPDNTVINDDQTGLHGLKNYLRPFERPSSHYKNSPVNERILRLADVYLLYAEACYHTSDEGTARTYVNLVRERARQGQTDVLKDLESDVTGQDLLDAIYHERRVELALENHRYFDLTRWGLMEKEIKTDGYLVTAKTTVVDGEYVVEPADAEPLKISNYNPTIHVLLPIPQSEVDITNGMISQNPGY